MVQKTKQVPQMGHFSPAYVTGVGTRGEVGYKAGHVVRQRGTWRWAR